MNGKKRLMEISDNNYLIYSLCSRKQNELFKASGKFLVAGLQLNKYSNTLLDLKHYSIPKIV